MGRNHKQREVKKSKGNYGRFSVGIFDTFSSRMCDNDRTKETDEMAGSWKEYLSE